MPALLSPGDVVAAKYVVERVLGQGGMGVVVAARHLALGETFAIKTLRAEGDPGEAAARLRLEARALARIRSKHVVHVADVGQLADGSPFIVMEHVRGSSLSEVLRSSGPLAPETAVDLVLQACDVLAEAHSLGIVHRDLKPSNLMLSELPDGSPWLYVLDFGIARAQGAWCATLTDSRALLGSPVYMSPEQIRDAHRVDARTDIWSLGVVLFELLSGELPFQCSSAAAALLSIATDSPRALAPLCPRASAALVSVVERCLCRDPDGRFADTSELARALEPLGSAASLGAAARIGRILLAPPSPPVAPLVPASSGDDDTRAGHGVMTATRGASTLGGPFVRVPVPSRARWALLPLALVPLILVAGLLTRSAAAPATTEPASPSASLVALPAHFPGTTTVSPEAPPSAQAPQAASESPSAPLASAPAAGPSAPASRPAPALLATSSGAARPPALKRPPAAPQGGNDLPEFGQRK